MIINPFITSGYVAPEYFCDREKETETLLRWLTNGNHVAIMSTRRMGKTGLIEHCFKQDEINGKYYTFLVDIYATKTLRDFVFRLGKSILDTLKPHKKQVWEKFITCLSSLRSSISFDSSGIPSWNLELGDIHTPAVTLDEIFKYLSEADKPCIVAVDEFQQVINYPEQNMEAVLRTYIDMFVNPSRPFYQSVTIMHLDAIDIEHYVLFAQHHFRIAGKNIKEEVIRSVYERFEGITWYIQKILNVLYAFTPQGEICTEDKVDIAIRFILESYHYTYSELLFQIPEKQKEILVAICKEGKAQNVTSAAFIKKYRLPSASSVQAALKGLLEKDFITKEQGTYQVYDRFFSLWLREQM